MPSPITTSGFQVQERLNPQYADPRLLTPQYERIIPSLSQGLGVASQFAQIADEAQSRPIRRQMQQLQLEEAQARLAMLPIQQQIQALQLGEAQQQAAIPEQIVEGVEIVGGTPGPAEFDDIYTPRERVTRGQSIAAGGVMSPYERRETLLTGEQVGAEAEKARLASLTATALANQRNRGKEFEVSALTQLIEDAKAEGDDEKVQIYEARLNKLNTVRPVLSSQDIYDRNIAKAASDAGITFDAAKRLADTPAGAAVLARAAASNKQAVASSPVPISLSASDRALIAQATEELPAPTGVARTFATIQDAEAAAAAGILKDGTKIIVGGKPATWRD